jgi:hypothetical protein
MTFRTLERSALAGQIYALGFQGLVKALQADDGPVASLGLSWADVGDTAATVRFLTSTYRLALEVWGTDDGATAAAVCLYRLDSSGRVKLVVSCTLTEQGKVLLSDAIASVDDPDGLRDIAAALFGPALLSRPRAER